MNKLCAICGDDMSLGTTTFTVDYKNGIIVVRNVSAFVCKQCGETWFDDTTSEQLEQLVKEAQTNHKQFEVLDFSLSAAA